MPYIDSSLAQIARILEDQTLNAEAKIVAIQAVTCRTEVTVSVHRSGAADVLGDVLTKLDTMGAASGLLPFEWFTEIKQELSLEGRYWNWLDAPEPGAVWDGPVDTRSIVLAHLPVGETTPFIRIKDKLAGTLSADAVRDGLLALQQDGLVDLEYGFGWFHVDSSDAEVPAEAQPSAPIPDDLSTPS